MPVNIDVALMPLETRLDIIRHTATRADELGYRGFALSETWAHSTPILLADLAGHTKSITLGTGILSIWGRSAATIAMTASTLHAISSGRFILGLGASTPQLAEGLHDVAFERPYSELRRILQQVRALLAGERVELTEKPDARALRLNLDPQPDIPMMLAATSDRSIQMVGELCDGWLPFLYPRDRLLDAMALIERSKANSYDPDRTIKITPSLPTVVAPDEATARAGAAWFVAFYITTMGTIYRDSISRMGFEREVKMVMDANAGQRASIVPPEAEILLEQLTVYGTPQQVRQRLDTWRLHDSITPNILLSPNLEPAAIDYTLGAFAGVN
ncbi:MAG: LLM class flavin-dependent oxidoreductase [Chloroflexi bacterium]|nr:LLM class flavin-dependent oxidoreductase [Chloroflexota bacterium]